MIIGLQRMDIPKVGGSFPLFTDILLALIGPSTEQQTMIDLCCNDAPVTSKLSFREKTYVDVRQRPVPEPERFVLADVLGDHPVLQKHYDVSLCLDGIEHLTDEGGWALLDRMKTISDRQVLFTPLDPWMMDIGSTNPESHKSVWNPPMLPGYAHVVMPQYHPSLEIGAFFFWSCPDLGKDFRRVYEILKNHPDLRRYLTVEGLI